MPRVNNARANRAAIVEWFNANPDEELTASDAAVKFGLTLKQARDALTKLRAEHGASVIRVIDRRRLSRAEQASMREVAP